MHCGACGPPDPGSPCICDGESELHCTHCGGAHPNKCRGGKDGPCFMTLVSCQKDKDYPKVRHSRPRPPPPPCDTDESTSCGEDCICERKAKCKGGVEFISEESKKQVLDLLSRVHERCPINEISKKCMAKKSEISVISENVEPPEEEVKLKKSEVDRGGCGAGCCPSKSGDSVNTAVQSEKSCGEDEKSISPASSCGMNGDKNSKSNGNNNDNGGCGCGKSGCEDESNGDNKPKPNGKKNDASGCGCEKSGGDDDICGDKKPKPNGKKNGNSSCEKSGNDEKINEDKKPKCCRKKKENDGCGCKKSGSDDDICGDKNPEPNGKKNGNGSCEKSGSDEEINEDKKSICNGNKNGNGGCGCKKSGGDEVKPEKKPKSTGKKNGKCACKGPNGKSKVEEKPKPLAKILNELNCDKKEEEDSDEDTCCEEKKGCPGCEDKEKKKKRSSEPKQIIPPFCLGSSSVASSVYPGPSKSECNKNDEKNSEECPGCPPKKKKCPAC